MNKSREPKQLIASLVSITNELQHYIWTYQSFGKRSFSRSRRSLRLNFRGRRLYIRLVAVAMGQVEHCRKNIVFHTVPRQTCNQYKQRCKPIFCYSENLRYTLTRFDIDCLRSKCRRNLRNLRNFRNPRNLRNLNFISKAGLYRWVLTCYRVCKRFIL